MGGVLIRYNYKQHLVIIAKKIVRKSLHHSTMTNTQLMETFDLPIEKKI